MYGHIQTLLLTTGIWTRISDFGEIKVINIGAAGRDSCSKQHLGIIEMDKLYAG
jgi:hypothetical protein